MQKNILNDVAEFVKHNRFRNVWRKVVSGLACCVVFCTTYALILPAITMEQPSFCGYEEHIHDESCYRQIEVPSELICTLVEIETVANGDMMAGAEGEISGAGEVLNVGEAVNTVGESDAGEAVNAGEVPIVSEALNAAGVSDAGEAVNTGEVPVAGETLNVDEVSNSADMTNAGETQVMSDINIEIIRSVSDSDGESFVENAPKQEEIITHTHNDECYGVAKEPPLTCELEEGEEHTHIFLCYGSWELVCTKEEHTHALVCFSDPEADVENEAVWEQTVANMSLTGVWTEDLVAIAKSQLGYTESERNYAVREDETLQGYTRYGAWYGNPYGEWETMFASFCINYAGVKDMPLNSDSAEWMKELSAQKLYRAAADYNPIPGDLCFLDKDGDGLSDYVGIVAEKIPATEEKQEQIKTVQGNISNQVQYVAYEAGDARIIGYGVLPKQPAPYFTYSDSQVQVQVTLPEDSQVPRTAKLVVTPIRQNDGSYTGLLEQAEGVVEGEITQIQFYDISFYTANQEYIPVNDKAQVTICLAEDMESSSTNTLVLHYDDNDKAPVIVMDDSIEEQVVISASNVTLQEEPAENMNTIVSFETEGFSTFAVVGVVSGVYEAHVLDQHYDLRGRLGESGKTYMIFNYKDLVDNSLDNGADTRAALKAETIIVQEKDVAAGTDYKSVSRLKGVEVVYEDYGVNSETNTRATLTTMKDEGLLWRFEQSTSTDSAGNTINTFTVRSVGTGKYLAINSQDGNLELSDNPYHFTSGAMYGENNIGIYIRNGNRYLAFYNQTQRPNIEKQHVFSSTTIDGEINTGGDYQAKVVLAEYQDATTSEVGLVTNLAGKIVAIIAVNNEIDSNNDNKNIVYPALGTIKPGTGSGELLAGMDVYQASVSDGSLVIGEIKDEERISQMAWEFEPTDVPGIYHIKVANIYDETSNEPVKQENQYLNISSSGVFTSGNPQAIEVVMAAVDESSIVKKNVVCLRTKIGDSYYTVQLNQNIGSWDFLSSGASTNNVEVSYGANHFVLVDLASPEPAQFRDWIDELPHTEDFDEVTRQEAGTTFAAQVEYRKKMRQLAMDAKAYYDEHWDTLSAVQKNYIGEKRIKKLLEDLEWLWREDPGRVTAAAPNATVKMFNYNDSVNGYDLATSNYFQFFSWDPDEKSVNAKVNDSNILERIIMSPTLGENGYPKIIGGYQEVSDGVYEYVPIDNGELDYLFDGRYQEGEAMGNGGGLFQQDGKGNYYYYSDMNAAWYDEGNKQFVLYDKVVRPEYTRLEYEVDNSETNDSRSNFFPFNEVEGNVIYDYPNGLDDTYVTTHYDNNTEIKTDTAYINDVIDLWFGMNIEYDFFIPKDRLVDGNEMIFKFHGDDDVFVYVDDVLVLDIGGTHEARSGSINFTTGEVTYQNIGNNLDESLEGKTDGDGNLIPVTETTTLAKLFKAAGKTNVAMDGDTLADYTMHNLKFFYMERGGTYSYAGIEFNMPPIPENTLEVSKEISTDDGVSIIDARLDYTFRVRSVFTEEGKDVVSDEFFVDSGAIYQIYENDKFVGDGNVGPDGCFTLKAGQKAVFYQITGSTNKFVVEEIMPTAIAEQYNELKFKNLSGRIFEPYKYIEGANTVCRTPVYQLGGSEESQDVYWSVICNNVVDENQLDILKITKREGEGTHIDDPNKEFLIKVEVGNNASDVIPLPMGTKYEVLSTNGEIAAREVNNENGVIALKAGETATIKGFLAGTYWQVTEDLSGLAENEHYTPFYSMKVNEGNEITGNSSTFVVRDTIEFFVTNFGCDFLVEFPLSKQTIGNTGNASFTFEVEEGTWTWGSEWTRNESWNPVSITVGGEDLKTEMVRVGGYTVTNQNTYYYKVYEKRNAGSFVYDENFYILVVGTEEVPDGTAIDGHRIVSRLQQVWRNGTEYIDIYNNPNPILFTNYKATTLTVEKEVINTSNSSDITNNEFAFEATIYMNGEIFTGINEPEAGTSAYGSYTVDENGKIHFSLKNGGSVTIPIPVNAVVTVTETPVSGYTTNYVVKRNGSEGELKSGTTTENISVNSDAITIHYTNSTGYKLPETGGSGTHLYMFGGLILTLAAAGLLCLKKRGAYKG